jgi:CO/xanthine dehydrogenase Mo-binding subunit
MACKRLKTELYNHAAEELGCPPKELELQIDRVVHPHSGREVPLSGMGDRFVIDDRYAAPESAPLQEGEASHYGKQDFTSRPTHWCYAYNTQAAIVAVDAKRGEVDVLHLLSANDVGKIINKQVVEGQIHGGVVMGMGYALSERYLIEEGFPVTTSLHDIRLPTAGKTPQISSLLVEVPHPFGPKGVKGFAEAPSLATAPAILNAIYDAVGVRLNEIPVDRKRLKAAMSVEDAI